MSSSIALRRRTSVVIATTVLIGVALGFFLTPNDEKEPQHNGHSLSYWVNSFGSELYSLNYIRTADESHSEFAAATNAISQIGTNAIPFLLKWVRYEPTSWRDRLARRVRQIPIVSKVAYFIQGAASDKARNAGASFHLLGTNAALAAPALARMMRDTNGHQTAVRAILALANMGNHTFPLLTRALSDTNQPERDCIIFAIYASMPQAVGTNACIPPLVSMLNDPNPNVRNAAKLVLERLRPQAIPTFPAAPTPDTYYWNNASTK